MSTAAPIRRPLPAEGEDIWLVPVGSPLHTVLSQAVADEAVNLLVAEGEGNTPRWSATPGGGNMNRSTSYRGSGQQMVRELLASPPMGVTDDAEAMLYALRLSDTPVVGNCDMYARADIDGEATVWRFESMLTQRGGFLMSLFRVA